MFQNILLVGAGGFLGSISRYGIAQLFAKFTNWNFPGGTFTVNIVGSFIIGVVLGMFEHGNVSASWKLFLAVGFCGGFTTFSSFAYENFNFLETKQFITFAMYAGLSIILGLLAVYLGFRLVK